MLLMLGSNCNFTFKASGLNSLFAYKDSNGSHEVCTHQKSGLPVKFENPASRFQRVWNPVYEAAKFANSILLMGLHPLISFWKLSPKSYKILSWLSHLVCSNLLYCRYGSVSMNFCHWWSHSRDVIEHHQDVWHSPGSDSITVYVGMCITTASYTSFCEDDVILTVRSFLLLLFIGIKLRAGLKLNQAFSPGQRVKEKIVLFLSPSVENKSVL